MNIVWFDAWLQDIRAKFLMCYEITNLRANSRNLKSFNRKKILASPVAFVVFIHLEKKTQRVELSRWISPLVNSCLCFSSIGMFRMLSSEFLPARITWPYHQIRLLFQFLHDACNLISTSTIIYSFASHFAFILLRTMLITLSQSLLV